MWVRKIAFLQSEFVSLFIHFAHKCFDIVLVSLIRKFECLLDQVVDITLLVTKNINFALHANDWHLGVFGLISNHKKPSAELRGKDDSRIIS